MNVSKVGESLFRLRDKVSEGGLRILHPHSLPAVPRRNAESDSIFANGLGDGLDNFEREPGTVLNRSAIFVRALVGDILKKLVWKVSVGEVELNPVKPSLVDGSVGGVSVPLDVSLNFVNRQGARSRVGGRNGDGGCADKFKVGVFGFKKFYVRGATESPKLEEDV